MSNETSIKPISVPPSKVWDGNDGPWSTFDIHAGTPPQAVRVLVSTVLGETWVVSDNVTQGGCLLKDSKDCPQSRGKLFNISTSTTFHDQGIFALGTEINLPDYTGEFENGHYGLERLGIGSGEADGATLDDQVVAGIATKDFYLGYLGVTSSPTNFSTFNDPKTSFLASLKNQGHIPSLTFGYTAGNQYRQQDIYGSLTLGGYDQSRFKPNNVSFQMAADISRDLVVGLQSITYSDAQNQDTILMAGGIYTFIDSTVPHIWLPSAACTAFEKAFGLQYNKTAQRYLVNDTNHEQLLRQNASVAFTLGNGITGGATVQINLPYKAFDLVASPPTVDSSTKYFPLRRAVNDSQFTLGRTFLQESYLIVDYERSNFSISECLFDKNSPQTLVAIPANVTTTGVTKIQTHKALSVGAIVGIVVGLVVIFTLMGLGAFFFVRRRKIIKMEEDEKKHLAEEEAVDPRNQKAELGGIPRQRMGELYGEYKPGLEMDSKDYNEMEANRFPEDAKLRAEMEGSKGGMEMESHEVQPDVKPRNAIPVEMWAGSHGIDETNGVDGHSRSSSTTRVPDSSIASRLPSSLGSGRPSPAITHDTRGSSPPLQRRQFSERSFGQDTSSGISSPSNDPSTEHDSGSELWPSRSNTGTPNYPARALSPQDISQSSSKTKHYRRGDNLTRRLEQTRQYQDQSHLSVSSPSSSNNDSERRRAHKGETDNFDRFNSRFGSQPRASNRNQDPSVSDPSSWGSRGQREAPPPVPPKSEVSSPSENETRRPRARARDGSSQSRSRTRRPNQSADTTPSFDDSRSRHNESMPGGYF